MFSKVIKFIVYALSILILVAFFVVIYGIYIKISPISQKNHNIEKVVSLSLFEGQKITDIQIIDKNRILIIINNNNEIQGLIFDINSQKIIQTIKK